MTPSPQSEQSPLPHGGATFTYEQIKATINKAADDILDAVNAPDDGLRDALNLMVNATLVRLGKPNLGLPEIVASNYEHETTFEDVLRWIRTAC